MPRVYDPRRRTDLLELIELLDVMLPGLDGDVLARRSADLRRQKPEFIRPASA